MSYEIASRITEIILQLVVAIIAWKALSVWKSEIRGRDKYKLAKELLEYIKELRFLVHSKNGSFHQIYLNDILVGKENFYNDQLSSIGKEKVYFDHSVWGLFSHVNTRSDVFLPNLIRSLLEELCPQSGKKISSDKGQYTYIQLSGVEVPQIHAIGNEKDSINDIYQMYSTELLTIEEYFKKWERLILELQKSIYD
ncbi:MAG: hypothetical protein Q7K16_00080 [Candidatus Azambacteria bacterium]|nr:hypothetical protein [Candidatus Azambacteria bacterium]